MAIFPPLDTGRQALLAQQAALAVVGQNIANVNTPGYSRQVADLEADPPIDSGGVTIGSGVHVRAVRQIVDPLLARQRLGAEADKGRQTALSDQLGSLAGIANDLSTPSLTSALGDSFDAADALARNPAGLAERQAFLGRATALTSELNRRGNGIAALQRAIDDRVVEAAGQANDDLAKIADLNRAIAAAEVGEQSANDLRDERQAVLNDLTSKVGTRVIEETDGSITVSAANGPVLVTHATVVSGIATQTGGPGLDGLALHDVGLSGPGGFIPVAGVFANGSVGGLVSARDGAVVTASTNLDALAVGLRDAVNALQTDPAARDLDGLATTAAPIFSGTGAKTLTVALTDPRRIGAALSTQPGDNQNALRLADLRDAPQAALGNATFGGYVAGEIARVGESAAQASDVAGASTLFAKQLEDQQLSISGVNLDEELTNLIKYQHAFQAAAQLINVSNQMLDELVHTI